MSRSVTLLIDLVAILLLVFGVYFPRYQRAEMVVAYLGINVGVASVAVALSLNTSIGTGFGLGLFGALSIIRLRSTELAQQEVAYYFAALALGLLGGIRVSPAWASVALPVAIVSVMYLGDHPRLFGSYRQQTTTLDRAIANETELKAELERRIGAPVSKLEVRKVDYVNDSTVVDVRYRVPRP